MKYELVDKNGYVLSYFAEGAFKSGTSTRVVNSNDVNPPYRIKDKRRAELLAELYEYEVREVST